MSGSTVAVVDAAPACELHSGQFSFDIVSYVLPVGSTITFSQNSTQIAINVFLAGDTSDSAGNIVYTLTSLNGGSLAGARVGSNSGLANTSVTKTFGESALVLTSTNGVPAPGPASFSSLNYLGAVLTVTDRYTVDDEGALISFSNTFVVPEPGTLGVLGLGMLGLGWARRRRTKALAG